MADIDVVAVLENMHDRLLFRSDEAGRKEQREAIAAFAKLIAAAERTRDNFRCVLSVICNCDEEFIDKQTADIDAALAACKPANAEGGAK